MRRQPWCVCGVMAVCLLAAISSSLRAEVIDRILAIVSGRVITLSDVRAASELGLVSSGSQADPVGAVLAGLIDRDLMLSEVERFVPPEPTADAIDDRLRAVRARFPTPDAYEAVLARSGIGEPQLRDTLRQNLLIQEYLDLRFTVPPPTDDEVARYYQAHPEAFSVGGRLPPLDAIRARVVDVMNDARRLTLVDDWVAGLRSRADIVNLYATRP